MIIWESSFPHYTTISDEKYQPNAQSRSCIHAQAFEELHLADTLRVSKH